MTIPDEDFSIPDDDRPMHIYMPGMTRYGKTTLLFWMAWQDICQDKGVCVMDAKGGLIDKLLKAIPPWRKDHVIALDLDMPVPLDFMGYRGEAEKRQVIGELKYLLLHTVETAHLPTIGANLTDVLYTLFNYNENPKTPDYCRATFLDIEYFLTDETRREQIKSRVTDKELLSRWENRWPDKQDISRLLTRMNPFIRSQSLKKIFGAKNPNLNIEREINNKSVILVNLAPMDEIQQMYGTLLLSKIRQAVYRRDPDSEITPFYLYCDEFQEFQTSDFARMLSMAGGLGLCLCLSHQYLFQLDPAILHSIRGNVSTFCLFRLGPEDAPSFGSQIPPMEKKKVWTRSPQTELMEWVERDVPFDTGLLTRIPRGQVLFKPPNGPANFVPTPAPPIPPEDNYAEYIRNRTKDLYSCGTPQVCVTKDDGHSGPKSDEIGAGAAPNVPPHQGKKKNS